MRNVTQMKTRDICFGFPRRRSEHYVFCREVERRCEVTPIQIMSHFLCSQHLEPSFFTSARCRSTLSSMTCFHSSRTRSTLSSAIVSAWSKLHTRQRGTEKVCIFGNRKQCGMDVRLFCLVGAVAVVVFEAEEIQGRWNVNTELARKNGEQRPTSN